MFLIDGILGAPARGLMLVFREVEKAARQEVEQRGNAIRAQLSELYLRLESGAMTEAEFGAQEGELLDRLDHIEAAEDANTDEEEDEDDPESDECEEEDGPEGGGEATG